MSVASASGAGTAGPAEREAHARRSTAAGWAIVALLVAVAVRAAAWLLLRRAVFCGVPSFGDAVHQTRYVLLLSGGFPETTLPWGSPIYPYLLAFFSTLVGAETPALLLLQGLIGAATVPLIAWALAPVMAPRGRWIAALVYALHPMGAFFEMRLQPLALAVVLMLVAMRLLFLEPEEKLRRRLLGGLALGVGFLLQASVFFALAVAAVWMRIRPHSAAPRGRARPGARIAAVQLAAFFLILPLIACLYNATLPGGALAWNWSDAQAFHRSLGSETWGAARAFDPPIWEEPGAARAVAYEAMGRRGSDGEIAGFYRQRGFQRLAENPLQLVGSLLWRGLLLVSRPEIPDPVSADYVLRTYAPPLVWGGQVFFPLWLFPLVLALAVLGTGLRWGEPGMRGFLPLVIAVAAANLLGTYSMASRWFTVVALLPAVAWGLTALPQLHARFHHERRARWTVLCAGGLLIVSIINVPQALLSAAGRSGPAGGYEERSEDLRYRAAVAARLQDQRGATALLRQALRENGRNTHARAALAELLMAEDLRDAARAEYEQVLATDPDHPEALYGLSEVLRLTAEYAPAESLAARLVQLHPRHPLYLNQYGVIVMMQGRFAHARYLFEQALQIAPDYQIAQMNLRTVEEAEREAPSLAFPDEMLPDVGDPLLALGQEALRAMAVEDWERADSLTGAGLAAAPENPFMWYVRGAFLYRAGEYRDAIPLLLRVVAAAPGRALTTEMAARSLLAVGRFDETEALVLEQIAQAADERNLRSLERVLEGVRSARRSAP